MSYLSFTSLQAHSSPSSSILLCLHQHSTSSLSSVLPEARAWTLGIRSTGPRTKQGSLAMFGSISIDSMPPSSSNGMPQADTFGWEQANNNTFAQESVPEFQHHPRNSDNQSACSTSATESDDTECSSKHHSQVLDWLANVDSTQDDKHTTAKVKTLSCRSPSVDHCFSSAHCLIRY